MHRDSEMTNVVIWKDGTTTQKRRSENFRSESIYFDKRRNGYQAAAKSRHNYE